MFIKFCINKSSYNSFGACRTCSFIKDFLNINSQGFGSAIKKIEIDVFFASKPGSKPRRTLEDIFERFHQSLGSLPTLKFSRKNRKVVLSFKSNAGYAEDLHVSGYGDPDLGLYKSVFSEIIENLEVLKNRIKSSDDFKLNEFFNWLNKQYKSTPQTHKEFIKFKTKIDLKIAKKIKVIDEWEKLDIDWQEYHPSARKRLNDVFFWDCIDEFSPHGNDTGADLLEFFRKWRKKNKKQSSEVFFQKLWHSFWGEDIKLEDARTLEPNHSALFDYDLLTVALAFAHIKYDDECPEWIAKKAMDSINRQIELYKNENFMHTEEYIKKCEKKISLIQFFQSKNERIRSKLEN